MSSPRPGLSPRRLAMLRHAAANPKGSIPSRGLTASDEIALEQLGYVASIDDCGHINTEGATCRGEHSSHPHFLRITPAGRAAAPDVPADREVDSHA